MRGREGSGGEVPTSAYINRQDGDAEANSTVRQDVQRMLRGDVVGDPRRELQRIRLANTGGFKLAHGIMTEQLYQDTKVVMHCTQVEWNLYTRWVTEILTPIQNARWVYMEMGNRKWSACLKQYIIETLVIAIISFSC